MAGKRAKGGGKLSRTQTVTVRLDPKLRYLAELAARKHRRTLSSYVEWAVEQSLEKIHLDKDRTLVDEADGLWDVDEADRFANLALRHPDLLTHSEQIKWKLIATNDYFWTGPFEMDRDRYGNRPVAGNELILERLRQHWETLGKVADRDEDASALPTEDSKGKEEEKTGTPIDHEDDIPF